jgi:hypothetical protein
MPYICFHDSATGDYFEIEVTTRRQFVDCRRYPGGKVTMECSFVPKVEDLPSSACAEYQKRLRRDEISPGYLAQVVAGSSLINMERTEYAQCAVGKR